MSLQSYSEPLARPSIPGFKVCENSGKFITRRPVTEKQLIQAARSVINAKFARGAPMGSPEEVRDFLQLRLADKQAEVFAGLFLNNAHCVIRFVEMFHGSLASAPVDAREVARLALKLNAAAVILAHNHPSGSLNPSDADRQLTNRLQQALAVVDVRLLDHFIIGNGRAFSFAECGMILPAK